MRLVPDVKPYERHLRFSDIEDVLLDRETAAGLSATKRVALYDNRVVVTSPGSLPAGLTTEQYLYGQISVLGNPIVAEVFLKPGYTGLSRGRTLAALETLIDRSVIARRGVGRSTKYERVS